MAYKYIQIHSISEAHEDEIVCAVYTNPIKNFTALATNPALIEALKDEECKLVVWRNEDKPNWYQGYNKYGNIVEKGVEDETKKPDVLQFSVDVEETDPTMMSVKIEDALVAAGLAVLGVEWSARWTYEGYHKGQAPISNY